ncbi:hypothetical protein [Lacticaseibacillus paracasei]|uniref:hypothetical protein n=1 Tax=Lacticaseibacillus paracasei TaxID=1597 RepID=UPI0024424A78|nr:hypothetical protein [Lacticaseibacillus paracasei]
MNKHSIHLTKDNDLFPEIAFSIVRIPLFEISEPILWSFEFENNVYVGYLLAHKQRDKTYDFLVRKSSYSNLLKVIQAKKSISSIFLDKIYRHKTLRFRKEINSKNMLTYSKTIPDKLELADFLPSSNFFLDEDIPNEISPDEAESQLKEAQIIQREIQKNYVFTGVTSQTTPLQKSVISLNGSQKKMTKKKESSTLSDQEHYIIKTTNFIKNNSDESEQPSGRDHIYLYENTHTAKNYYDSNQTTMLAQLYDIHLS